MIPYLTRHYYSKLCAPLVFWLGPNNNLGYADSLRLWTIASDYFGTIVVSVIRFYPDLGPRLSLFDDLFLHGAVYLKYKRSRLWDH